MPRTAFPELLGGGGAWAPAVLRVAQPHCGCGQGRVWLGTGLQSLHCLLYIFSSFPISKLERLGRDNLLWEAQPCLGWKKETRPLGWELWSPLTALVV
jgi:hypothetical protein